MAKSKNIELCFFFYNNHIFIGETDSVSKNGGYRQSWWGHYFERNFLRGQNGVTPESKIVLSGSESSLTVIMVPQRQK